MVNYTTNNFLNGSIKIIQSKKGYRFSIDAVLLSNHILPKPGDKIIDLGTGCGIIPLLIASKYTDIKIYGIEIQKKLAETANLNVVENSMTDKIKILSMDMKELSFNMTDGPASIIISNPPYRRITSGRINPDSQRAVARHEIKITLNQMIKTASKMLKTAGKFVTIYPAERIVDLLSAMRKENLEPKFLRCIHSEPGKEAKLIIISANKRGGRGTKILPPLFIYKKDGEYTDEVKSMFTLQKET